MGFRTGAYAKVWEVTPVTDKDTKIRISISLKNKQTGQYETDWSGYCHCYGSAVAEKAAKLKEGDKIQLGNVDERNFYDAEKQQKFYVHKIFSFTVPDDVYGSTRGIDVSDPTPEDVDDGEIDDSNLPF